MEWWSDLFLHFITAAEGRVSEYCIGFNLNYSCMLIGDSLLYLLLYLLLDYCWFMLLVQNRAF